MRGSRIKLHDDAFIVKICDFHPDQKLFAFFNINHQNVIYTEGAKNCKICYKIYDHVVVVEMGNNVSGQRDNVRLTQEDLITIILVQKLLFVQMINNIKIFGGFKPVCADDGAKETERWYKRVTNLPVFPMRHKRIFTGD